MLNFTDDFSSITSHYTMLMPYISQIAIDIEKIKAINMDEHLKARYIAELKGLRGYYTEILCLYYGPVPIRVDAADVNNLTAAVLPRPSKQDNVNQIIQDLTQASDGLPDTFTGEDYGRFSKAAAYTALMKLYMQEKRWADAVSVDNKIKAMSYALVPDYRDNFDIKAKGGNSKYRDAKAEGDIGAVMVKFGPDPTKTNSELSGVDMPVFRYADVILLLAEALNEQNNGPTNEAFSLLNDVRVTHGGLTPYTTGSLNHDQFLAKLQNERLFELWAEGVRRDDLIRWGLYVKRAIDDGSTFADDNKVLYPLPRTVINQSKGVIKQNPGYN